MLSHEQSEYVSPKEAALLLGLSLPTVYAQLNAGRLSAFKVGRSTRIARSEIARFTMANKYPIGFTGKRCVAKTTGAST